MKIDSKLLIEDLVKRTRVHISAAQEFEKLSDEKLNRRSAPDSWSILECLEHLNLYGDFYIPEIGQCLANAADEKSTKPFKSSWLGEYFSNAMLPKEKPKKMKTFKEMNPIGSKLDPSVITKFIGQQQQILELLSIAGNKNLSRVKTSISISKFIKLRLGDTFRVVIYHNERHIQQAKKVLAVSQ